MKRQHVVPAIALAFVFNVALAADETQERQSSDNSSDEVEVTPSSDAAEANRLINDLGGFCFFAGYPPAEQKYTVIRKLKVGKGSYGSVRDILPRLADNARMAGADAIIRYTGSQRFGFFPWRVVRPVVRGIAVKWTDSNKPECAAIGGTTLQTIISTDTPPIR
ncbi:hypothetical protein EDC30_10897 [Paucimonas lemoignei]|uniref:Uncharacterized protein n=1 Tax=Paucimonas lemoignei TaxID=29443 RepID=A0A4R3HU73_PAULE|nr:hypothetical protein [Paucimonas lemoignei]TCS36033.1 hypothetical protein EDC30_10897 [Paucimonas lemoignei]